LGPSGCLRQVVGARVLPAASRRGAAPVARGCGCCGFVQNRLLVATRKVHTVGMDVPRAVTEEMIKAAVAAAANTVLPVVGPATVATLFTLWGNHRSDRFTHYVISMLKRGLDTRDFEDPNDGPIRLGLFDAGARQSMAAASEERVEHIAALVAGGMTSGRAEVSHRHYLLRLLSELNDIQVLWLIAASLPRPLQDDFWRSHLNALNARRPTRFSTQGEIRQFAVHTGYVAHLANVGLVAPAGAPLTDLGRVLLDAIDQLRRPAYETDPAYEAEQRDGSRRLAPYLDAVRQHVVEKASGFALGQGLAPPRLLEPERNFAFGMELLTLSSERHRLWVLPSPAGSYLSASFEILESDGTRRTVNSSPDARVDVREDKAGSFAFIGNRREYDVERTAEFLLEPLLNAISPLQKIEPRRAGPRRGGPHDRVVPRYG